MKVMTKYIMLAVAGATLFSASAQSEDNEKFVIKATANMGIGKALELSSALSGMSYDSSSSDYGIDFGMTIWHHKPHSLQANIGLGYGLTTVNASLPEMHFQYDAPPEADMDMDTYIRCTDLDGMYQKTKSQRIILPLYVDYGYKFSKVFSLHALFGFKFAYNFSTKATKASGNLFNYGIYPQYDNLMIDAPYMNEFGASVISAKMVNKPKTNSVTAAFLAGIGAEFHIWGPLSVDASLRYEGSMCDLFKSANSEILEFYSSNAPVTYTVAEGQRATPLPSYFSVSKMRQFSYSISLLYRF